MLFSSPIFFLFFTIYLVLHCLLPQRLRLFLVIVGSSVFYAYWNPYYVLLPFLLTIFCFYGAQWISKGGSKRLYFVIATLFVPLIVFKYANFLFTNSFGLLTGNSDKIINLSLPLGISFVTFTLAAYVIDVWRGKYAVETKLERLLGCVLFFPHLIAGPIVRPSQLIPQLARPNTPKINRRILLGVFIFSMGLFKKLVLADPIAAAVDAIYISSEVLSSWHYLLAFFGFTAQIYLDFSGYTDMALGSAHVLGVRLPKNFERPYLATSLIEFWKRWHLSLSSWLRDYLYISLGGNRRGFALQMRNLMITMILGGLWHGANWTFVLWGIFHGLGLVVSHFHQTKKVLPRLPGWCGLALTFMFVSVGWVFFRAPDLSIASRILGNLVTSHWGNALPFLEANAFVALAVGFSFLTHRWDNHSHFRLWTRKLPVPVTCGIVVFLFLLSIIISAGSSSQFIYFEF